MGRQRNPVPFTILVQGHQRRVRRGIAVGAVQLEAVKTALPSQFRKQPVRQGGNVNRPVRTMQPVAGAAGVHHVKRKHAAGMRRRQFEQFFFLHPERIPFPQGKPFRLFGQAAERLLHLPDFPPVPPPGLFRQLIKLLPEHGPFLPRLPFYIPLAGLPPPEPVSPTGALHAVIQVKHQRHDGIAAALRQQLAVNILRIHQARLEKTDDPLQLADASRRFQTRPRSPWTHAGKDEIHQEPPGKDLVVEQMAVGVYG